VISTFLRSAGVGLVATTVTMIVLFGMVEGIGTSETAANAPSYLAGLGVQYLGNKYLAFQEPSPSHRRQAPRFMAVELVALVLNLVGYHLVVVYTPVPYWVTRLLVSAVVYVGWQFPMWGRIFREEPVG
jgi:putative flippase GtrA